MLTEERFETILAIVNEKKSITVTELMERLHTSESTIRRDLTALDRQGRLKKVHGGAVANDMSYMTKDDDVEKRKALHVEEKRKIAGFAASLIEDDDFVYLDAGTTVEQMLPFINKNATYVTNALSHIKRLSAMGCKAYILGGEFKSATEAVVGEEAIFSMEKYHFTKGFFGTNGITKKQGFTTPEIREGLIKRKGMEHTKECFVLADTSKFDEISAVTFGDFADATILTVHANDKYKKYKNVIDVEEYEKGGGI